MANPAVAPVLRLSSIVVAGWPPVALLLAVELLTLNRKHDGHVQTQGVSPNASAPYGSGVRAISVRAAVKHLLKQSPAPFDEFRDRRRVGPTSLTPCGRSARVDTSRRAKVGTLSPRTVSPGVEACCDQRSCEHLAAWRQYRSSRGWNHSVPHPVSWPGNGKIGRGLDTEHTRLQWLSGRVAVPTIVAYQRRTDLDLLLTHTAPGADLMSSAYLATPKRTVGLIAGAARTALRQRQWLPVRYLPAWCCPHSRRCLPAQLRRRRQHDNRLPRSQRSRDRRPIHRYRGRTVEYWAQHRRPALQAFLPHIRYGSAESRTRRTAAA